MAKAQLAGKRTRSTPTGSRIQVKYTKACDVCRQKKLGCDGFRPICRRCQDSGHHHQCAWTGESARKPRTEAHFEAMRTRAGILQQHIRILESMLEQCQREHGGTLHNGQSFRQLRPKELIEENESMDSGELDHGSDAEISSDEDDTTAEHWVSAQNLKLDERDLVFYGNAAPFRFASAPNVVLKHVSIIPDVEIDLSARYTLMIEGADYSHIKPDFDWSRYLPPQVPLDREEHDRILDLLFKFFSSWCMRVVPVLFLRDMYRFLSVPRSHTPPKTAHYSPMLHNALLAVATGFSDNIRIRDYKARKYFADEAKRLMESECQKPNVSVVHALSMLASFHSSSGDQGLGYVYFGIGARVSQALGLSVDCSEWVEKGLITTHDMYDRNWAYWTTFTQEICWSLYVGRDSSVSTPSEGHTIPVPYIDAEYDQIPWFHPSAGIAPQPNYLSRTFAATCQLLIIARRVNGVVNSLHVSGNRREVKDELINSIDIQLHEWKERLSPEVDITLSNKNTSTPHKLMMHLSFWWIFILLHRPFFHRSKRATQGVDIDHVKLCKTAADKIMELLGIYHSLYSVRFVPVTPVQIAFASGTVFVLLAVQAAAGLRVAKKELETSVEQAELCIRYLTEMGRSWKCSSDIADILKGLVAAQLKPVLDRIAIGNAAARKNVRALPRTGPGKSTVLKDGEPSYSSSSASGVFQDQDQDSPSPGSTLPSLPITDPDVEANLPRTLFSISSSSVHHQRANSYSSDQALHSSAGSISSSFPSYSPSFTLTSFPGASTGREPPSDLFMHQTDPGPSTPSAMSIPADESLSNYFPFDSLDYTGSMSMISSMETSRFLAMLGDGSISHSPCIPPLSSMEYTDPAGDLMSDLRYFFQLTPELGSVSSTTDMRDAHPMHAEGNSSDDLEVSGVM